PRSRSACAAFSAAVRHSSSTGSPVDRFWRNARAHTLHEPVSHRLRDVGDYFLNGAHPPFTLPA
ncbi:acyl-CoA dehydrogenase, partial [Streptomyces sp. NPDC001027]